MKRLIKTAIATLIFASPSVRAESFTDTDLAAFEALINIRDSFSILPLPMVKVDFLGFATDDTLRVGVAVCGFMGCQVDRELNVEIDRTTSDAPAVYSSTWVSPRPYPFNPKPFEYYVVANTILFAKSCLDEKAPVQNVLTALNTSLNDLGQYEIELELIEDQGRGGFRNKVKLRILSHSSGYPISCESI